VFFASAGQTHVLKHGHVREQGIALKDGIDVAIFGWNLGYVLVLKMDMAVIDAFQPGDKAQDGGFAAAGGASYQFKFARRETKINVLKDGVITHTKANIPDIQKIFFIIHSDSINRCNKNSL
jgi:hypothetical protein